MPQYETQLSRLIVRSCCSHRSAGPLFGKCLDKRSPRPEHASIWVGNAIGEATWQNEGAWVAEGNSYVSCTSQRADAPALVTYELRHVRAVNRVQPWTGGAAMWELICHHTYKAQGRPVDISRYDNPAERTGAAYVVDGVQPGSGALRFTGSSRVVVAPGPAWNPLVAIKVELTFRLTEPLSGPRQTLIDADSSFGIFHRTQKLFAYFVGTSVYPGMTSDGLNTYQDGVSFPGYRIPHGKWVALTFVHDGLGAMQLFADGVPVTVARSVLSGVPPVGPRGVSIGNGLDGDGGPAAGEIDEVKIWRVDPLVDMWQYLSRPVDQVTRDCWERFSAGLDAALAMYPDCALKLDVEFTGLVERIARAILDKGPESRQRFIDVAREFQRLWRAGHIDGPEMAKLLADWIGWLRLIGISIESDAGMLAYQNSYCLKVMLGELGRFDCDARYVALLKLIADALRQSPAQPARV